MQESFQLAHETLYLAVVMTDLYMSKRDVRRDEMQLIGATAILLSSKFYVSLLLFLYFIRVYTCFFKKNLMCYFRNDTRHILMISFLFVTKHIHANNSLKPKWNSLLL